MSELQSVTGPVPSSRLGMVLPHEHVAIDRAATGGMDAYLVDYDLSRRELELFRAGGGATLVDCTTSEIGRNPVWLRRLSDETGVTIIMGTGHYRHPFLDNAWMDSHTVDEIAIELIQEIEIGVGDTGVRAGIVGEIGSNGPHVSAIEERSFRAAARAHLATGVTLTTHAALFPVGLAQLDILQHEGVSSRRVIVGHCDTVYDPAYHLAVAERGAFVQFDTLHQQSPYDIDLRVQFVMNLVKAGRAQQILLSHDVCLRSHLTALGGKGYMFLFNDFLPRLVKAGLTECDAMTLVTDNPRRALTGED